MTPADNLPEPPMDTMRQRLVRVFAEPPAKPL